MRKYLPLVLALAFFVPSGAWAEPLKLNNTYDLGDDYSLHFGRKSGGLLHSRNIIGIRKNDFTMEGDAMTFTLNRPHNDFGGDRASLGFIYTRPLQENVTSTLSFNGGPTKRSMDRQDVAVSFYIHVKLP